MVLSFEGLSGTPWGQNRYVLAERLHKLYPSAKIVLCTRDQDAYVKSLYSQYVKGGGTRGICWFRRYLNDCEFLDWTNYIKTLHTLWAEVLILPFESLQKNPISLVEIIADFIGVPMNYQIDFNPVNEKLGKRQMKVLLFMNKFFKSRWNKKGLLPRWVHPYPVWRWVMKRVN